jgi:hypothetical protein
MLIDCDACTARGPACGDCVVSVLLQDANGTSPRPGVDIDGAERAAIGVLAGSGLVPPLRLVRITAADDHPDDPRRRRVG